MTGPDVTLVLSPAADDVPRVASGTLVDRTNNCLEIVMSDPVELSPGEALVVIVHDEPSEVLLAIGLAREPVVDGNADRIRLRPVERRA
jgi:hypothetical protein